MAGCLLVRTALFRSSSVTGRCLPAARSRRGNRTILRRCRAVPKQPAASLKVYWSRSPIDSAARVVGYQALGVSPIVVLAQALAEEAVFQPWRSHSVVVLAGTILLLGLIGFLIVLLQKHRRREQLEQTRLIQAQRLEAVGRIADGIAR